MKRISDAIPGACLLKVINTAAGISSPGCGYEWPLCMTGMLIMNGHCAGRALLCNLDVISQAVQNLHESLKQDCERRGNEDKGISKEGASQALWKKQSQVLIKGFQLKFAEKYSKS